MRLRRSRSWRWGLRCSRRVEAPATPTPCHGRRRPRRDPIARRSTSATPVTRAASATAACEAAADRSMAGPSTRRAPFGVATIRTRARPAQAAFASARRPPTMAVRPRAVGCAGFSTPRPRAFGGRVVGHHAPRDPQQHARVPDFRTSSRRLLWKSSRGRRTSERSRSPTTEQVGSRGNMQTPRFHAFCHTAQSAPLQRFPKPNPRRRRDSNPW